MLSKHCSNTAQNLFRLQAKPVQTVFEQSLSRD
jgi:hypothetical protein